MQRFIQPLVDQLTPVVGGYVLNLLGAVVILVLGWVVALIASATVRGVLKRTSLDNRMAQWLLGDAAADSVPIERYAARAVFYLIMIFVLVAFFQTLQLTAITEPLNALLQTITAFIPRLFAAGVLLLAAVVIASALRRALTLAAKSAEIDRRLGGEGAGDADLPLTKAISDGIYWLVLILFLPAVLGVLAIEGLLAPVQGLMDRVLGFLPNILGAAIIVFVGWLVARLCQRVVAKLLAAIGLDRLGEGVGLDRVMGESRVSDLVGLVVYVLIIIPVVMSALDALSLAAITGPATLMLTQMLGVLPSLFAATLLLAVAYVVARVVSGVITRVLTAVGFDNVLAHVGFTVQGEATRGPSAVAGTVVVVAILLVASIEAAGLLGFDTLAGLMADVVMFGANLLLGMLIFGVGLYLSRVAAEAIKASGAAQAALLSTAARGAIVVLSGTMALQQMQVASDIIAIAFGLGARESAGRAVETWIKALQER
jgi:hypothetical protein